MSSENKDTKHSVKVMADNLLPKEIVEYAANISAEKDRYSFKKLSLLSFLAGVYIAIGGLLAVVMAYGMPGITAQNPAIIKFAMGAFFPIGIILVAIAGAELFTGNCAYFIPAVMNGTVKWYRVLRNWVIVWMGNFVGALFFLYLFVHLTHVLHGESWIDGLNQIATAKTSNPFFVTVLKGMAANWLVCLAMWLGMSTKSTSGKILGLWLPVMAFVTIGYEHSIANMFFLPMAMFSGFELSIVDLFCKNLIPATIGNILGGALFVGAIYWYCYIKGSSKK